MAVRLLAWAFACAAALASWLFLASAQPWPFARYLFLARTSGAAAALMLGLALLVSPLARLLPFVGLGERASGAARLRRGLGMAAACLALVHAVLSCVLLLDGKVQLVLSVPRLRAGGLALLVLLALLVTSFPRLVARLRFVPWKALHVLAFVAAWLSLEHVLLSPFAPLALVLGLFAALVLLGLLRLLPKRRP